MRQKFSEITGSAMANLKPIGMPLIETGYDELPKDLQVVQPPSTELHPLLTRTAVGSAQHWITRASGMMAQQLTSLPFPLLDAAANDLTATLAAFDAAMLPVSKERIASDVGAIAEMMTVPVPTETGLRLYYAALSDMPLVIWKAARDYVVKNHKWPRLPLPADFREAGKEEAERLDTLRRLIERMADRFSRARDTALMQVDGHNPAPMHKERTT